MGLVFGIVQIANKFQLDAPENTNYLRLSYGSVQLITLALIAYIYWRINKKNDETKLTYSEPKNPFSAEENPIIQTTYKEYDLGQAKALATQTLMGVAIIAFMHYQWGYLRPLLLQSVLGFRTLAAAPVVQVWLFGRVAEGELSRPWRAPNPFGNPPEAATPKDVKKAEKKEEKKKIANKKTD